MANFTDPEDFSSVNWTKSGSDINANAATAPDGTSTGDRLNSTNTTLSYLAQNGHVVSSGQNCINIFAKEDDSGYGIILASVGYDVSANGNTYFDLVNGAVGDVSSNHDDALITLINGWYRCTIVFTTTTDLNGAPRFYISDGNLDANTPIGTSIFVWGAYSNAGASPEPYVSQAGITVPSSSARIIRNVTRDVTRDITKNLIDF